MPRRALVTGGLGFIGSTLTRRLLALGWEVAVIDALVEGHGGRRTNIAQAPSNLEIVTADVCDERALGPLVEGRDAVFHFAGQRSHIDSMHRPTRDLDFNCRAALAVLEACRVKNPGTRLIYSSTRQVYGVPQRLPVDETHPSRPIDVNGVHKLAVEHYLGVYARAYGLRSCILRLTNTYGPRMYITDAKQGFLGLWIGELLRGRELVIFGDGTQKRDFNYVDDVVDACVLAAERDAAVGETINLGAAPPVSLNETAELLIALNGGSGSYRQAPFPAENRAIDIGDYAADYGKAARLLGWTPRTPLSDGLARTLAHFRAEASHKAGVLIDPIS